MADEAKLWVNRGEANEEGEFYEYTVPAGEGMVVLDAIHWIQQNVEPDLAARWNCKAAKCGSCSAEVNGKPSLMCKTRLSDFPEGEAITVEPMRTFPRVRDLVTDVSWNYEINKLITPFTPPDEPQSEWRWQQEDGERSQEFRKCIECFLCMDTCHVLRNHETEYEFFGPRFFVRAASLEMHPLDQADRAEQLKYQGGIGYCNINKCCTEVCPEYIKITDNAIIPLKERVADQYYDPVRWLWRKIRGVHYGSSAEAGAGAAAAGPAVEVSDEARALDGKAGGGTAPGSTAKAADATDSGQKASGTKAADAASSAKKASGTRSSGTGASSGAKTSSGRKASGAKKSGTGASSAKKAPDTKSSGQKSSGTKSSGTGPTAD